MHKGPLAPGWDKWRRAILPLKMCNANACNNQLLHSRASITTTMPGEQWASTATFKNELARATSTSMVYFISYHDYNANGWGKLKIPFHNWYTDTLLDLQKYFCALN